MKVFGLIGWKGSGKTYFAQKIIYSLTKKNIKVASIKRAHHDFDIDHPNTDSFLHRMSGSSQVIVSSSKRWVKITELLDSPEQTLDELIKKLDETDIVIVEGFKKSSHPKIEVIDNPSDDSQFMFNKHYKNIVGIISNTKIDSFQKKQFKKNEIDEIVEFILNYKNE